jgi:hypothetical protein
VIEAQEQRRQFAGIDEMLDIAGAEQAGGEADEYRQRHEIDIEIIDQDQRRRRRPVDDQPEAGDHGQSGRQDIEPRRQSVSGHQDQPDCGQKRQPQDRGNDGQGETHQRRSPRKFSR